ncbi:uncharacterized protein LOC127838955 [Dreissena polymorpha]|uniref:Secreted protein n=1 Tax=Dreissena polymorpha TaxID=45954 RepID=A0A9D4FHP2_DREPO|nr:uncharacterized protein LOC127838955 [Dreissena polymorpha]KAH3799058.1 hypothetical protein DPMN_152661 [Dreissena polymorpha]
MYAASSLVLALVTCGSFFSNLEAQNTTQIYSTTRPHPSTMKNDGGPSSEASIYLNGTAPPCGSCDACPAGYSAYHTYDCRCLCENAGMGSMQNSSGIPRGLLARILRNMKNNADALEHMATGLSDEADIAEEVANNRF